MKTRLCENLKLYRKRNHLTQEQISDLLGMSRSAYSRYEEGSNRPNYLILQKLADHYGITVDDLLGRGSDELLAKPEISEDELCELFLNASQAARGAAFLVLEHVQRINERS